MHQYPPVRPMSKESIRGEAHELWVEFVNLVGPDHVLRYGVNFDEMYEALIYPRYEIELDRNQSLGEDDSGVPVLGEFLPVHNAALIDRRLFETNDRRLIFTTIHEVIGHGILHGPFLRKHAKKFPRLLSTVDSTGQTKHGFDLRQMNTFEWQANAFAANVVAPRTYIWCLWIKLFGTDRLLTYRGPGEYFLSYMGKPRSFYVNTPYHLAWVIAKKMRYYFWGLSTQCIAYQVAAAVIRYKGYELGDKVPWGSPNATEQEIRRVWDA